MLETLTDLPPNTVGWRASGTITREEYDEQILQPIHAAITAHRGKLNLIFETADDFGGLDLGALYEDTKTSGAIGIRHRHDWGKIAVITDEAWMRKAISAFGWLVPGHHRVFKAGEFDEAIDWIAAG